jgi:hypothetical protein
MITQNELKQKITYCPSTGLFEWIKSTNKGRKANSVPTKVSPHGYYRIHLNSERYYAHRLAWFYINGDWPLGHIDHINGDKLDNRMANLRVASNRENCLNSKTRKNNTSGYKGVSFMKRDGTWTARISANGKYKHLGYFKTAEEAHAAYCSAAIQYHGEFANFGGKA